MCAIQCPHSAVSMTKFRIKTVLMQCRAVLLRPVNASKQAAYIHLKLTPLKVAIRTRVPLCHVTLKTLLPIARRGTSIEWLFGYVLV